MGKKLKKYILFIQGLLNDENGIEDIPQLKQSLLAEIEFWQHERLIHLLVTVLFAVLTMAVLLVSMFYVSLPLLLLLLLFLALLVPYLRHYYILENGVQKLYTFYEELLRRENPKYTPDFEKIPWKAEKSKK